MSNPNVDNTPAKFDSNKVRSDLMDWMVQVTNCGKYGSKLFEGLDKYIENHITDLSVRERKTIAHQLCTFVKK